MFAAGERPLALVTGATGGIGRALVGRLAEAGMDLLLSARSGPALAALADTLPPGRARHHACDLARDVGLLADAALALPRLDLIVHAAGVHDSGPWEATDDGTLRTLLAVNVEAPTLLTRLLLPRLRAAQGMVVFLNSTRGLDVAEHVGPYAASKHALRALADTLRLEIQGSGIRVLSVYPGSTATPMQQAIQAAKGHAYDPDAFIRPDDIAAMVMAALALPRTAEVSDITIRPLGRPPDPSPAAGPATA
ncbi:SDR family oxidoreductase [Rhodocista pekingensis]|uniref:SDR family oxidoreductase n=1 Tax=Rhodocista pekingensis TaxID=201185 RepID=A0ABW2KUY1_9PROT